MRVDLYLLDAITARSNKVWMTWMRIIALFRGKVIGKQTCTLTVQYMMNGAVWCTSIVHRVTYTIAVHLVPMLRKALSGGSMGKVKALVNQQAVALVKKNKSFIIGSDSDKPFIKRGAKRKAKESADELVEGYNTIQGRTRKYPKVPSP